MFKGMSNREFSDWLADEAYRLELREVRRFDPLPALIEGLREASQRIKSSHEFQTDVRVTPKWEDQP